jgi:hypothetical protein
LRDFSGTPIGGFTGKDPDNLVSRQGNYNLGFQGQAELTEGDSSPREKKHTVQVDDKVINSLHLTGV